MSARAVGNVATLARARHVVVAVDGPAGSGKSTVGRDLSAALGCPYVDTGLMYRAVTLRALDQGVSQSDERGLEQLAGEIAFDIDSISGSLLIDGMAPYPRLRSPEVDATVSAVSAHRAVRRLMVARQRELARDRCIIMVGRDIGTVVLPDAPVKLWITASPAERARRRLAEQLPGSDAMTFDEMARRIGERDELDSNRSVSPLRRAAGSVDIDTEHASQEEALEQALDAIARALGPADAVVQGDRRQIAGGGTHG